MEEQRSGRPRGEISSGWSDWNELEDAASDYDRCVLDAIYALDIIDLVPSEDQLATIAAELHVRLRGLTGSERSGVLAVTVKSIVCRLDYLRPQVGTKAAEGYGVGPKVPLHFYPWDEAKCGPWEDEEKRSLIRETLARTDFERVADSAPIDRAASRVAATKDSYVCLGCGKLFGTPKAMNLHRRLCERE